MSPPSRAVPRLRRRLALGALVLAVALAHGWLGRELGLGLADAPDAPPAAIDVRFVQELPLQAPPRLSAPPPARRRALPQPAQAAASAPQTEPEAPRLAEAPTEAPAEPAADLPREVPAMALDGPGGGLMPVQGSPEAPPLVDPNWPPSSQLLYVMEGQYRGPIHGEAQVDWLRDGDHYQVRLEVRVPPLFTRRMLSDGTLGPDGLVPSRYDQETQVALQATRRETVRFEGQQVTLGNGKTAERLPGVQDVASQFVQMTWLFLTRPERLQPGAVVEFPLALPRRVGRWTYDVRGRETLELPFGPVETVHLQPRAEQLRPNELNVETWVAPGLLYLPVRIVIRQDADNFLDLRLRSRPKIAGPAPAASGLVPGGAATGRAGP